MKSEMLKLKFFHTNQVPCLDLDISRWEVPEGNFSAIGFKKSSKQTRVQVRGQQIQPKDRIQPTITLGAAGIFYICNGLKTNDT